jgi:hypothetical protein
MQWLKQLLQIKYKDGRYAGIVQGFQGTDALRTILILRKDSNALNGSCSSPIASGSYTCTGTGTCNGTSEREYGTEKLKFHMYYISPLWTNGPCIGRDCDPKVGHCQ